MKHNFQKKIGSKFKQEEPPYKNEMYRGKGNLTPTKGSVSIDKLKKDNASGEKGGNRCPG